MNKTTPARTDDQRKVLELRRDHPNANLKDIVGMLDDAALDYDYVEGVVHNFHLPEEDQQRHTMFANSKKRHNSRDADGEDNDTEDSKPDGDDHSETDDVDDFVPAERCRRVDSLGKKSKQVVEYIRDNPDAKSGEIAEHVDSAEQTVRRTVRNYCHLIPDDAAVFERYGDPTEEGLEDLSPKQRRIIEHVRDNPTHGPTETSTHVDAGESYISTTIQEYAHLVPEEAAEVFKGIQRNPGLANFGRDDFKTQGREEVEESKRHSGGVIWENEYERLEFLNRVGSISDDEYERKIAELDELDEGEEDEDEAAVDEKVTSDEDGRPVIDATEQYITERPEITSDGNETADEKTVETTHPSLEGYDNVVRVTGDEEEASSIEKFIADIEDELVEEAADATTIDVDAIETAKAEFEWHRENHDELTDFALGMKRVLDLLGA